MPLYEYECEKCKDVFEVMQKFSDEPLTRHEKCGGPVHRLVSAPAIQFKGSGWYVTDYARGGKTTDNGGAEKKADAPGGEKSASDAASGAEAAKSSSSEKTSSSETKAESSSEKK